MEMVCAPLEWDFMSAVQPHKQVAHLLSRNDLSSSGQQEAHFSTRPCQFPLLHTEVSWRKGKKKEISCYFFFIIYFFQTSGDQTLH